jgi:hypothetical protein
VEQQQGNTMSLVETEIEYKIERSPSIEGDSGWKSILDSYFRQSVEFLYPSLYKKIDWLKGYQFLDRELDAIMRQAKVGKRSVDKLVRVQSFEGKEAFILLHVEVQSAYQSHFSRRLFEYYCRLYLRYQQPIVVLVILTDDSPTWKPESYQSIVWDKTVIQFNFYTNKLLDYRGQELILEESNNPFAWVVLVQLAAIKTRHDSHTRFQQKFILARYLYKHNFNRKMVVALFTFMDWVLTLPEELEIRYNEEIKQFEGEKRMRHITSIERYGIQKGVRKGECAMLERLLQCKFHPVPSQYLDKLHKADSDTLLKWGDSILKAKSLTEVFGE